MKNLTTIGRACGFAVALAALACTPQAPGPQELVFNTYVKERIKGLDPAAAQDIFSQQALVQVYEGLLHFHYLKRPIELMPLLAQAMPEVSADRLTYTFKIKNYF